MNPDFVRVELPPYEPPPPWLPPQKRINNPMYDCDLRMFLPRTVLLHRQSPESSLGFHIRGGVEQNCGLYISKVLENSEADRLGLREGDQVLAVNNTSFENIDHAEAVSILKGSLRVEMTVRYFPYGYRKTYNMVESSSPAVSPR